MIKSFLDAGNNIVFHKPLAKIIGINATVFIMHLISKYNEFERKGELNKDLGFFLTVQKIEDETCLTINEQRAVKEKLQSLGIITIKKEGLPARNFYYINFEILNDLLSYNNNTSAVKITPLDKGKSHDILYNNIKDNNIKDSNSFSKEKTKTPKEESEEFFKLGINSKIAIDLLEKYGDGIKEELKKFWLYWTERNKSGTKQRWEMEKTFEVSRRISTWLMNCKNNKTRYTKEKEHIKIF